MEHQILDTDYSQKANNILSPQAIGFLSETRKWTKFLSILGFIGIGLMILAGFFMGSILSKLGNVPNANIPTAFFAVIYTIIALIYFFPVLYLFNFSNSLGRALSNNSSEDLTKAFGSLKSHYKFIGILAIIFISIYGLMFLIAMLTFALK